MSGNTYEFVYFNLKGLGNMIRILLEDQGIPYKFTQAKWPDMKPETPFGQLPMLIINGGEAKLSQSHTIVRFLARECGIMGSNSLETAQIEMYIDQSADVRKKFLTMMFTDYENGRQPFIDSIPELLAPFEKTLAATADKKHLLLNKLTAADYIVFDLLLFLNNLSPGCLEKTPSVKTFFDSFGSREKLRAFMDSQEWKNTKFTPKDP